MAKDDLSKEDNDNTTESTEEQRSDEVEGDPDPSGGSSVIEEGDENEDEDENKKKAAVVDEEDEEVRIAMEMALMAVKNPKLSPDEVRKLVFAKTAEEKQKEFVKQVEEKKARQKIKAEEEANQASNQIKNSMFSWFYGQSPEEYQWAQEKAKYADKIKSDKQVRDTKKAIKVKRKGLKAIRLQGNRVETRHIFKRQRMEKHLLEVEEAIEKQLYLLTHSKAYDATTYAKAMMKATKKWSKQTSSQGKEPTAEEDQALALESQLCRNMHQMLALEKQKAKLKKSLREIKKYLQRCKSWLSDKQALCELHMMTLDATQTSMKNIYEDTLKRQDAFIQKLLDDNNKENDTGSFAEGTFAPGSDLRALLASVPLDVSQKYDELPSHSGPGATLNALRGLPFRDSFCLSKAPSRDGKGGRDEKTREDIAASGRDLHDEEQRRGSPARNGQRRDLVIHTHDDNASVSSALSDPDDDPNHTMPAPGEHDISADSVSGKIAFGEDAPWLGAGGGGGEEDHDDDDDDEDNEKGEKKKKAPPSGRQEREKLSDKKRINGQVEQKKTEKSFDKKSSTPEKKNGSNGVSKKSSSEKKAPKGIST